MTVCIDAVHRPLAVTPLAVTMGEPAGIGPDITLKCWLRRDELDLQPYFVIADKTVLAERAALLGIEVPIVEIDDLATAMRCFGKALPVFHIDCPKPVPGTPSNDTANAVISSIERAVQFTRSGLASAVVTNPIAKSILAQAGFEHPGHTEFLAALCSDGSTPPRPVMMIAGPDLKVVPVTIHMALKDVAGALNKDLIVETAQIAADALKHHFGIASPRLAVAGLNPHAGEDGRFGDEDLRIVEPAVVQMRSEGLDAIGPLPADTMFHAEARRRYDLAICMYHDQALIPAKTLAFDEAVNVTLGLPFARTSPDHGTAFDLAGTGRARENSLASALRLATTLSQSGTAGESAAIG